MRFARKSLIIGKKGVFTGSPNSTKNREKTGKEKRLENMAPQWKPGQSGNPAGPPKGHKKIKTQLRKFLAYKSGETDPETGETLDNYDAMMFSMLKRALKGDLAAQNSIMDRLEGKPLQKAEVKTNLSDQFKELHDNYKKGVSNAEANEVRREENGEG